jgi:hypothetical protein
MCECYRFKHEGDEVSWWRIWFSPDSTLKRMGLERHEIVPAAYRAALDRRERRRGGAADR